MLLIIYTFFSKYLNPRCRKYCRKREVNNEFISYCEGGNTDMVKKLLFEENFKECNMEDGIKLSLMHNNADILSFLLEFISKYDTEKTKTKEWKTFLNTCVRLTSKNNRLVSTEILVKNGASTAIALANTSSNNIIRSIYNIEHERKQNNTTNK